MNAGELRDIRTNASEVDIAIQYINNENTPKLAYIIYVHQQEHRKKSYVMNKHEPSYMFRQYIAILMQT